MTKEEAITWSMNDWPRMQCIYLQHLVGSLFCVPSILVIGDPSVASSLAICGVLSEIGWELQDLAEMFFVRAFCKNGKATWPDSIVFIFLLHHSLTTILGLPMVLYYRDNRSLHWLCFNLQFAAAVGEFTVYICSALFHFMVMWDVSNHILLYKLHSRCFAAAVALSIGEYTKLLDVSKPSSLRQFKVLNFFALVTMLWTRVIHWSYLW